MEESEAETQARTIARSSLRRVDGWIKDLAMELFEYFEEQGIELKAVAVDNRMRAVISEEFADVPFRQRDRLNELAFKGQIIACILVAYPKEILAWRVQNATRLQLLRKARGQ